MNKEQKKATLGALGILITNVAGMYGLTVVDNIWAQLIVGVSMLALIVAGVFFNFNFTKAAGICQKILDAMKRYDAEVIEKAKELAAEATADEVAAKANR